MAYIGSRPDNVISRNAQNEYNYTATGGQTTFTGVDSNNNTLSYTPGNIEVYFNGARLEESDFTATNGTSIVLANAAVVNDELSIVAMRVFEVESISNFNTSDLTEGSNLYFTNARADARIAAADTDDLSEGSTNLYFTNARVAGYLSSNDFDTATNIVASITDSAPSTLDTLNELAAALGDDANFSTTVTNSIATKLPLSGGTMTGDIAMGTHQIVFDNNSQAIQIKDAGGTASYVLYQDNADTLILGNGTNVEKIRLDTSGNEGAVVIDTNGNVGIGTASPGSTLDVRGEIRLDSGGSTSRSIYFRNQDSSSTGGGQLRSDQHLSLHAGNGAGSPTQYVTIKPGGNVGIGETSPDEKLHITNSTGSYIKHEGPSSGDYATGYQIFEGSTTSAAFYTNPTHDLTILSKDGITFRLDNANRIKFTSTGNVGIGTTSPDGKLTVALENSNTPAFRLSSPTSSTDFAISSYNDANGTYVSMGVNHLFDVSGNDAVMDTNDKSAAIVLDGRNNGRIQFLTNSSGIATPRMTILQDGNAGIGTTSPTNVKLQINKSGSDTVGDGHIGFGGGSTPLWAIRGGAADFDLRIDRSYAGWQSTPALSIRRMNGNVGIGTDTASTKLHVKSGGGGNSNGSLYLEIDTATNYPAMVIQTATGGNTTETHGLYIKNTAAGYGLRIDDTSSDTSPFVVDSGGNVGIGDSNPTSLLSISKNSTRTTDFENMLRITHTSSGTTGVGFGSAIYFLGERENGALQAMGRLLFDAEVNSGTNISSGFSVQTATAGSPSEKFRITHDGYIHANSQSQIRLTLGNAGTPGTNTANWIRSNGNSLGLNAASDNIHFEIGGQPKMELTTDNLELPSNYTYNSVDGFQFNYPTGRMQLGFNYNAFGAEIILGNNRTASGETAFLQYRTNGVTEGTLVGNGSGFSITNVSDYRKKENINELPDGSLEKVINVRPVTYTLKEEYTNDTSKIYTGFIAHEFQEQFPNSVRGVKDELNEDGTPKLQSIDIASNELLTHLIKSIQELKTENDALKARLDTAGL